MINWKRANKDAGGGLIGYVLDQPVYRMWSKEDDTRHSFGRFWHVGVWVDGPNTGWKSIGSDLAGSSRNNELKRIAEAHLAEYLPQLLGVLKTIGPAKADPVTDTDAPPILKFPSLV